MLRLPTSLNMVMSSIGIMPMPKDCTARSPPWHSLDLSESYGGNPLIITPVCRCSVAIPVCPSILVGKLLVYLSLVSPQTCC